MTDPQAPVVRETSALEADLAAVVAHLGDATSTGAIVRWLLSIASANTRQAYGHDVAAFGEWLGRGIVDPDRPVEPVEVNLYARHLESEGFKKATRKRRLASVSSLYRWVLRQQITDPTFPRLIEANPADPDLIERPKSDGGDRSPTSALTTEQMRAMLACAEDHGRRDWLAISLMGICGLRVAEMIAAKGGDVGVDRGHITLRVRGKGDKHRTVVLPPAIAEVLGDVDDDQALVDDNDGNPLNRYQVGRLVTRIANRAEITGVKVTPHVLRSTMITEALAAGARLVAVQEAAGHKQSATTEGYNRRAQALDRSPVYLLASRWATDPTTPDPIETP